MQLELAIIGIEEKAELEAMLLNYFKEIDNSKIVQTNTEETIDYPYLDSYWTDPTRSPIKFIYMDETIGFTLINNWTICKAFNADNSIAEFFIKPQFRRKGLGKMLAYQLFNTYKGKWEIRQSSTNPKAIKFWRAIINEFTNGDFKEINNKTIEYIQLFESK